MNDKKKDEYNEMPFNNFMAFIPPKLSIKDRPELAFFPENVLIARFTVRNGIRGLGSVKYEPAIPTFYDNCENHIATMNYHSNCNPRYRLEISYNYKKHTRECIKYYDTQYLGTADGGEDWRKFFIQVGLLGLTIGEKCVFERA